MPELPEVETLRRSLAPIVGRRVERVRVLRRDVVIAPGDPARARAGAAARRITGAMLLAGALVESLDRRGKQLAVMGDDGRAIIIQLGMTGAVVRTPWGISRRGARGEREAHTHIEWLLDDGSTLAFIDPRRFGGVRAGLSTEDVHALWDGTLGPDALTIRGAALRAALARSERPIKSALLDQGVLAGVGNIYADEALFDARVHPAEASGALAADRVARLAASIRATLHRAIACGGSTLRDYRDADGAPGGFAARHAVYGRGGLPCRRCGVVLVSAVLAQRTTTWCPACQPEISPTHPRRNRAGSAVAGRGRVADADRRAAL